MAATLEVTHELGFGIELRRGRFEVLVDGRTVGAVAQHETIDTSVAAGHHIMSIRKGRSSSRALAVEVADGEVARFVCHGVRSWPMYLASIAAPQLAIRLKQR